MKIHNGLNAKSTEGVKTAMCGNVLTRENNASKEADVTCELCIGWQGRRARDDAEARKDGRPPRTLTKKVRA